MTRAELDAFLAPAFAALREQVLDLVHAELHANTRATLELVADAMKRSFTDGAARRYDVRAEHNSGRRTTPTEVVRGKSPRLSRKRTVQSGARVEEHRDAAASDSSSEGAAGPLTPRIGRYQQGQDLPPSTSHDVRGGGRLSPRSAVPEPAVAAEQGSTSPRRKPNSCRKCGAVGFTAATCGTTHNVSIVDAGERGSGYSAPHVTQQGADTPGQRESAAAGNVADPHRTPIGHRGAGPATSILSAIPKTPAPRVKLSPAELEAAKQRAADRRAADARRNAPPPALAAA